MNTILLDFQSVCMHACVGVGVCVCVQVLYWWCKSGGMIVFAGQSKWIYQGWNPFKAKCGCDLQNYFFQFHERNLS